MAFTIQKITAFISVGPDGEEGIIGSRLADGSWLPFVCADEKRIEQVFPIAEQIAKANSIEYKIVQFDNRVDVTDQIKEQYKK